MKIRAYITHKQAEKYSDCADYFGICPLTKRVAVSDGVSQSIMPLEWAKILVNAFVNDGWDPETGVSSLQEKWFKEAKDYLDAQRNQGKNPWMLENCITNRDGAGATFCGIEFFDDSRWKAKILGDSCLILLDKNKEIIKILSSKEGNFDNRPDYFDSFKKQKGAIKEEDGDLKGHTILLVSDPFSELFQTFQNSAEEKVIVERLLALNGYKSYVELVDAYRDYYHMHNDDSTMVIIEYDHSAEFDIQEEYNLVSLQEEEAKAEKDAEEEKRREEDLWQNALIGNTIESYQKYLDSSTSKLHKKEAEDNISSLRQERKEQEIWDKAENENSVQSYREYLNRYPKGKHSQEATNRIGNINMSSETNHDKEQAEPSEQSSEDDDRCGQSDNTANNPSLPESNMEKVDKTKGTEQTYSAAPEECAAHACQAESEEDSDYSATDEKDAEQDGSTTTKADTEPGCPIAEITSPPKAPFPTAPQESRPWDKKKMANEAIAQTGQDEIHIPGSVDSSDGIDRKEFRDLFTTANNLFKRHREEFKKAFAERRWRDKPEECFERFWHELEEIIYNSHG